MVCLSLPREVDTGDFISIVSNFYGIKHYCSNGLGERERERERERGGIGVWEWWNKKMIEHSKLSTSI